MNAEPKIATRLTLELDATHRTVRVTWEPAGHVGANRACLIDTARMIQRIADLVNVLDDWSLPYIFDAAERKGYYRAVEQLCGCEELEALRSAVAKFKPFLALTNHIGAGGQRTLFDDLSNGPGLPDARFTGTNGRR